jgi:hypothetical protein
MKRDPERVVAIERMYAEVERLSHPGHRQTSAKTGRTPAAEALAWRKPQADSVLSK